MRITTVLASWVFQFLGWCRPEQQLDVPGLIAHLLPRLVELSKVWWKPDKPPTQAYTAALFMVLFMQCIILNEPPVHASDLQALVHFLHQQDAMQALTSAAVWLYMQIPRFAWVMGQAVKIYRLFLVWRFRCAQLRPALRWTPDPAYIQHHGRTPTSGHCTTILATGDQHWILDDEKTRASSQLKLMIMRVVTYT